MGDGGRGKQQQQDLYNQAQADRNAIQETPEEAELRQEREQFRSDVAGGKDVKDTAYLSPYFNLYGNAATDQAAERKSEGLLTLGAQGGNSQAAAALKQYLDARRQQEAAGQLQQAYGAAQADVNGQAFQYAQLDNSRNLGKAGLSTQAYNTYAQIQASKVPWWQRVGQLAVGGASAYFGRPQT